VASCGRPVLFGFLRRQIMSRWSKVKAALLAAWLIPAVQLGGCINLSDLLEDAIIARLFD
jgi:hypothetical protein